MIPAILFDMNGVLIDDEDLHRAAFQHVVTKVNLSMSDDDYRVFFAGRTDEAGFRAFFAERAPRQLALIGDFLERKTHSYQELAKTNLRRYGGAAELVHRLRDTNHQLALVTSSIRDEVTVVLDFLALGDAFHTVVTAEDVTEGKPSPVPYLTGAKRLGRLPAECVVIEDAPSGISSAKAAGMACAAVTSTHGAGELALADLLVGQISDLAPATLDELVI